MIKASYSKKGMVKNLDHLNRLQLPKELCSVLNYRKNQTVNISLNKKNDHIVVRKFQKGCVLCNTTEPVINHLGNFVCHNCIQQLSNGGKKADGEFKRSIEKNG